MIMICWYVLDADTNGEAAIQKRLKLLSMARCPSAFGYLNARIVSSACYRHGFLNHNTKKKKTSVCCESRCSGCTGERL